MKDFLQIQSWFIVAVVLFGNNIQAQSQYRFQHFDSSDGLASDFAASMAQDSLGYIWIHYAGAWSRFDGYNFKIFKHDPRDSSRSALNFVPGPLYADAMGRIWITEHHHSPGSPFILVRYDQKKDFFGKFLVDIGTSAVSRIAFEPNGSRVWLGTYGEGLYCFDTRTRQTQLYFNQNSDSSVRPLVNRIRGIVDRDSLVILSSTEGLWKFDKTTKSFSRPLCDPADSLLLYHSNIHMITDTNDGYLWLVIQSDVLKVDEKFRVVQRFSFPFKLPGIFYAVDKSGVLWFPGQDGLIRLDSRDSSITKIQSIPGDNHSLRTNSLIRVFVDREENLWVTSDQGLSKLLRPNLKFYNFDIDGIYASSLFRDRKTDYVVVGRNGIPELSDDENEVLIAPLSGGNPGDLKFRSLIRPIMGAAIQDFYQGKNTFWMAVVANGVEGIPGVVGLPIDSVSGSWKTGSLIPLYHEPGNDDKITLNSVVSLWEDDNNDLWVGQRDGGVDKVNFRVPYGKKGSVLHYPANSKSGYLFPNDGTSFWTSGTNGVDLVRLAANGGSKVTVEYTQETEELVDFVFRASDTTLFMSTWNGLYAGKQKGDRYTFDNIPLWNKDEVVGMQVDNLGRLWFRVLAGVVCYNLKEGMATEFKKVDGIEHVGDLNFGRIHKSRNGLMVVSGLDGVSVFDPQSFSIGRQPTNPAITALVVNNNPVHISQSNESTDFNLPNDIGILEELVLDYQHNNFSLEFSAMEMTAPEKNLYRHRLEGYDPGWIENGWKNRRATYTNLPAGDYVFKVKSSNYYGVWSENEKRLKVKILPPPWRTWWAYAAYLMLVAGGLVVARRTVVQRERLKSNLKLEHIELEKAKEVDRVKTSFFTNISHEFRTPLTLIKGPVEALLERFKDDPDVILRLKLVQRNSDLLLKLINQLLDLAKLESGSLKVEKSEGDPFSFIRAVASSFESLARQKGVALVIDIPANGTSFLFDKDKLETILINLINNAIKFTPSGGKVSVSADCDFTAEAQRHRGALRLQVADTGIGIPQDQHAKIFERFHQVSEAHKEVGTGIGLSLVKELVTLMGGTISVKSELGSGSEFMVRLPIEIVQVTGDQYSVIGSTDMTSRTEPRISSNEQPTAEKKGILSIEYPIKNTEVDSTKPHVLVVEDNSDLRAFIIDSLGPEFHFLEGADGKQGLEIATREVPDLIISDVMMPEMDGITMAGKIKSDIRTSHIPLILLTAKSTEESKLSGLQSGADDYLTKPFNRNELLLKVRNGVSRQQKLREKLRAELMSEGPRVEVMSADEQFLNNVKEKILERLSDEQLSVESLAEDIGMSRVQLYRKVSGLTGIAVNELIRKLRLQKAAQLLQQKWGPVSQVAYEVGFSNLSYFSKVFKEEFGVLPSEYNSVEK